MELGHGLWPKGIGGMPAGIEVAIAPRSVAPTLSLRHSRLTLTH